MSEQPGYSSFISEMGPGYELIDVKDLSSGRYIGQGSVYKLIFIDRNTRATVAYVLRQPVKSSIPIKKPVNEEFYSRYSELFEKKPYWARLYNGLVFAEFVEGIESGKLIDELQIRREYQHLEEELIASFAYQAALADAVLKGDRDIGFSGVNDSEAPGNYKIELSSDGRHIVRVVSIDNEYVFNRKDRFTLESADKGYIEMSFLTLLSEYRNLDQRAALFNKFKRYYKEMKARIRNDKETVKDLIRRLYGEKEVKIFEANLSRDTDVWLDWLFEKTQKFYSRRNRLFT
ncbi:hypothetical protein ACFLZ2_00075 [Candidatus Margulisiibacteriota bacterium]